MLIIRADQLTALGAAMLESFQRRLLEHLTRVFPDRVGGWGPEQTAAVIDAAMSQAATFGLAAERDVARFVDLVTALGPEFPDRPATGWTRPVLEDSMLAPGERLDRVFRRLGEERPDLAPLWKAWR